MRPGGRVTNFECIDVKDLRITPASLRLRRVVIGLSVAYILVFTPILGYFIYNYMMAQPQLRTADGGDSAKACLNRRIPMHFAFHRGQHGNGTAPLAHHGNHSAEWPPTEKRLGLVANLLGTHQANASGTENQAGGRSHAVPDKNSFQQAAVAGADTAGQKIPASEPIRRDDSLDTNRAFPGDASAITENASTRESHVMHQQRWPELGKQLEAGGQQPGDANQRDHLPPPSINSLPVQMAHQEIAPGDGLLEIGDDGPVPTGRPGADVGPLFAKVNRNAGTFEARKPHLDELRESTLLRRTANQSPNKENLGLRDKTPASDKAGVSGAFENDQKRRNENREQDRKSEHSTSEVEKVRAALPLQEYNRRNLRNKEEMYALSEVNTGEEVSMSEGPNKMFSATSRGHISRPDDGKSAQVVGLPSSRVSENKTAIEFRRRRAESLKFKLKKYRRLSKVASDAMRKTALDGKRRDARNIMRQLNIGLQKELPWRTSEQDARKKSRLLSDGLRTRRKQNGSAASSTDNTDEQRMLKGMPDGKDDNEVLSFAEFFKGHLSSKKAPSKVRDDLRVVHGRRLMIDYLTKKKTKQSLTEGIVAGGWPERPKEPAPTKYTLDPFHPYIARRGPGWDFYDPLKPPTERNNARELAEQEFYSPEQPSGEVQDAPTLAQGLPSNRSSLHDALGPRRQEEAGNLDERSPGDADVGAREIFDAPSSDVRHEYKPWAEKKGAESLSDHHGSSRKSDFGQSFQAPRGSVISVSKTSGFPKEGGENDFGNSVPIFPSEHQLTSERIRGYNEGAIAGSSKRSEGKYVSHASANEGGSVNHFAKARVGTGNDAFPGGHPADPEQAATRIVLLTEDGGRGGTRINTAPREPIRHNDTSFGAGTKKALPKETTFKTGLSSGGIRVSEANTTTSEDNDSRWARPRLLKGDAVPILPPGYDVPNGNFTTGKPDVDDTALEIDENVYEDMVPSEDRNVIWSGPRDGLDQPADYNRGDVSSQPGHTERGPNGTSQTTEKYGAVVMNLTPPNASVVNQLVTLNDSGVSSVEALSSGGPATGLIGSEIEKDFEDSRMKIMPLEIDAVTAKKREPPSEPPAVDVLIQNRVGTTSGTSGSVFVPPGDEKPRLGVPAIFHKRVSSPETGSTKESHDTQPSSKKESLNADIQSQGNVTARTDTAPLPKQESRSTGATSEEPTEPVINLTDTLRRNTVNSSASFGLRQTHQDLRTTSPGMLTDTHNMSVEGTRHHVTASASHDVPPVTSSKIHITIEVVRKRSDSKNNLNAFRRKKRKRRPVSSSKSSSTITVEASSHQEVSQKRLEKEIHFTASSASSHKREAESQGILRTVPTIKPAVEVANHSSPRGDSGELGKNETIPATSMEGSHQTKAENQGTLSTVPSIKPAVEVSNHSSPRGDSRELYKHETIPATSMGGSHQTKAESQGTLSTVPSIKPHTDVTIPSASSTQITELSVPVTDKGVSEKIPEKERPPRETSSNAPNVSTGSVTDHENSSTNQAARNSTPYPTDASENETTARSYARALIELGNVAQNSTTTEPPTKVSADTSSHSQPDKGGSGEITHAKEEHDTTGKSETFPTQAQSMRKSAIIEARNNLSSLDNVTEASKAALPTTAVREISDDSKGLKTFETTDEKASMLSSTNEALSTVALSSTKASPLGTAPKTGTVLPTSNHTNKTSTPEAKTLAGSSTKAPPFRTASTTDTSLEKSNKTTETATPETKSQDMMGVFDDDDKIFRDLYGVESGARGKHSTEKAPESLEPRVSTDIALNPRLIVVRTSTPERKNTVKSLESPTPEEEWFKPRLVVVRRGSNTSQTTPEWNGPKTGGAQKNAAAAATVETAPPTALEFPGEYDEYDGEDPMGRRMHFPMVKIRRRPSTTRRRLAMMDLFGRAAPTAHRTSLHPRLQHRIAARRGHRTSPRSWPYHMTLFHDEPLNAVRIAVKRRG